MAIRGGREGWLGETLLRLLLARERYGLEMTDQVQAAWGAEDGGNGAIAEGSVYAALRRLEHGGLVVGQWVDAGEDKPRRRYYTLSPKGVRAAETRRIGDARTSPAARGARP